MDAIAAYPASASPAPAPVQAPPATQARPAVTSDTNGPDTATVQRTRADSASFSQEALRRLAQDQQAKQIPSADGTSGG